MAALVTLAASIGAPTALAGRDAPIRILQQDSGGLIPLAGGALLAWESRGKIAVRDRAGMWGGAFDNGVERIDAAVPDRDGALLVGAINGKNGIEDGVILLVASDGRATARWVLPNLPVNSTAQVHGRRWAATARGLVELLAGGAVEPRAPAESSAFLLAGSDGTPVVCVPANMTKAHFAPARCHSVEGPSWQASDAWWMPPFACGMALIEHGEDALVSRNIRDGHELAHLRVAPDTVAACGTTAEVIVASSGDVSGYGADDFARRWRRRLRGGAVTAVARAGDDVIVFRRQGAPLTLHAPTP